MKDIQLIKLAARIAVLKRDRRNQKHGAVAVRKDGVIVASANGHQRNPEPKHHAEARALRKAGKGADLFLVRVSDGKYADTTPCNHCQNLIRKREVRRVVYTAHDGSLLVWWPDIQAEPKRGSKPAIVSANERLIGDLYKSGKWQWLPSKEAAPGNFFGLDRDSVSLEDLRPKYYGPLEFYEAVTHMTWLDLVRTKSMETSSKRVECAIGEMNHRMSPRV